MEEDYQYMLNIRDAPAYICSTYIPVYYRALQVKSLRDESTYTTTAAQLF